MYRKLHWTALACAAFSLAHSCATIEQARRSVRGVFRPLPVPSAAAVKRGDQITVEELEQLTFGFADHYLTYIITATENIERENANSEQRRRAHQVRLVQVSAIYDIVTNADPFTRLLDYVGGDVAEPEKDRGRPSGALVRRARAADDPRGVFAARLERHAKSK